jgi:hypothetical protein
MRTSWTASVTAPSGIAPVTRRSDSERPDISSSMRAGLASATASVATVSPERSTVTASARAAISSILWVMKSTARPSATRRRTAAKRRSRTEMSSAAVASSRMRRRGFRRSERAMTAAWRVPRSRSATRVRRSGRLPVSSSITASASVRRRWAGMRKRNRSSWPSQRLSRSDNSSRTRISWKVVAMPARRAAGRLAKRVGRPSKANVPESGWRTPVRILTRVDLPLPFSPMTAWTVPGRTTRLQSRSARVSPNALATPSTRTRGTTSPLRGAAAAVMP